MSVRKEVTDALQGYVTDGELIISWVVTMEVLAPSGGRYLAHRAGGGSEGEEPPMAWAVAGMLDASLEDARGQTMEAMRRIEPDEPSEAR